ncbi:MAG TPA: ATP-dependent DNA helicase PcrA [Deltaproteobacteria bacterium]|nr:ATP-dependent DNA helicase PcrA [Deltaproteobacteria bacterium]HCP47819.1 ATP-dependent DNA helicase PcrA [Deltaproteobacteria bacterium]
MTPAADRQPIEALVEGLNDAQRAAVTHPGGPLLVLAGAGSGKTRVLTLRLAWILERLGHRPHEVMGVTFTNKAAGEMKSRVTDILGQRGHDCWVSTFHSACLRILRREIEHVEGFASDFVIYDARDSRELLKRIIKEAKLPKTVNPNGIASIIDRAKNDAIAPDALRAQMKPGAHPQTPEIYQRYQERLQQANAFDFGDLLLTVLRLFEDKPEVLARYQQRFQHLLVDEYQDTNHAQYRLLRLLADHGQRNITVVGDEDQSIYSFRGADIRNILDFERDFEGAQTVRLERNYRSTSTILTAATAVVERNVDRKGKVLWTERQGGEPISLEVAYDDREEARRVVDRAQQVLGQGRKAADIGVFFRTNAQSRLLEEEFLASGLPFVLVGGQRFYERKEVKDALAYLRLLVNPQDEVSLVRIINNPPRGIGARTLGDIGTRAASKGIDLGQALVELASDPDSKPRVQKALGGFIDLMTSLRRESETLPLPQLLGSLYEKTGMVKRLEDDGSFEAQGRIANLEELLAATVDYGPMAPPAGLTAFLDRVSLVADTDRLPDDEQDQGRITLMTVHSAKGLEFPVVFVVGMDEGLFPHARASTFQSELEEERRLAYVAITRAREELVLFRARRRPAGGGMRYEGSQPSRFLRDIPRELLSGQVAARDLGRAAVQAQKGPEFPGDSWVEYDEAPSGFGGISRQRASPARKTSPSWRSRFDRPQQSSEAEKPQDGTSNQERVVTELEEGDVESMLRVGARVLHPSFGEGEIRSLDGPPDNLRATVFFRKGGSKRLYLRFAQLELISH